jgi:site-specific DNA-methyltransferase (adenine-specific)
VGNGKAAELGEELMLKPTNYNPDVLSCLANLSSDEVFTPPDLANQVLDQLPASLWRNKDARFLDPCSKSGVFLREIARRLLAGLAEEIPDLQERINHIFSRQLYGIAITALTAHLTRRTVYCSKHAAGQYSIVDVFDDDAGNIVFDRVEHTWKDGRCVFCGASQENYERGEGLESHAYQFIHTTKPEEVFGKMKFDVIVGNPPYQLSDGMGGGGSSAMPLYHLFIQKAKQMAPRYLSMIVPSRWFAGGKGLDEFRKEMLNDSRIRKLIDFPIASECFPGVEIKGGVCYFLWDRDNPGNCEVTTIQGKNSSTIERPLLENGSEVFIRFNDSITIFHKVRSFNEATFADLISPRKPFGFASDFSNFKKTPFNGAVEIYANKTTGWIEKNLITQNTDAIDKYKVYISFAYGAGEDFPHQILNKPFLGKPNTCCTETYLLIGPFDSEIIAKNVISYISTRFFRFMVLLIKSTQNATKKVYQFVPLQDFSEPWTDEKLYAKYGLTQEEIAFIESMVRPMEAGE